ncbi:hypothetical protein L9F63_022856, partial [Diploptera punctata]
KKPHITVKKANEMIRLRDKLIEEFKGVKRANVDTYNKYKKQEQSMIDAINNLGTKLEKVVEHEHEHSTSLVPLTSTSTSTSSKAITQHAMKSNSSQVEEDYTTSKTLQRLEALQHKGSFIFTIPILFSALGAIGALAGGVVVIANAVHNKNKNDEELEEQKRHNLAMETKSDPPNVVVE